MCGLLGYPVIKAFSTRTMSKKMDVFCKKKQSGQFFVVKQVFA